MTAMIKVIDLVIWTTSHNIVYILISWSYGWPGSRSSVEVVFTLSDVDDAVTHHWLMSASAAAWTDSSFDSTIINISL